MQDDIYEGHFIKGKSRCPHILFHWSPDTAVSWNNNYPQCVVNYMSVLLFDNSLISGSFKGPCTTMKMYILILTASGLRDFWKRTVSLHVSSLMRNKDIILLGLAAERASATQWRCKWIFKYVDARTHEITSNALKINAANIIYCFNVNRAKNAAGHEIVPDKDAYINMGLAV